MNMEPQELANSQNNLEKEGQSWRLHTSFFQNILQSNSNQDGVILAYRPKEQNREPTNEPLCIWPNDFRQGSQDCTMGERQSLQQMVLGKLDIYMQKK